MGSLFSALVTRTSVACLAHLEGLGRFKTRRVACWYWNVKVFFHRAQFVHFWERYLSTRSSALNTHPYTRMRQSNGTPEALNTFHLSRSSARHNILILPLIDAFRQGFSWGLLPHSGKECCGIHNFWVLIQYFFPRKNCTNCQNQFMKVFLAKIDFQLISNLLP